MPAPGPIANRCDTPQTSAHFNPFQHENEYKQFLADFSYSSGLSHTVPDLPYRCGATRATGGMPRGSAGTPLWGGCTAPCSRIRMSSTQCTRMDRKLRAFSLPMQLMSSRCVVVVLTRVTPSNTRRRWLLSSEALRTEMTASHHLQLEYDVYIQLSAHYGCPTPSGVAGGYVI